MTITLMPGATTLAQLYTIWTRETAVTLDASARPKIEAAARMVAQAAAGDDAVYGVNTGFGKLARVKIAPAVVLAMPWSMQQRG